jgi:hypothetical protein
MIWDTEGKLKDSAFDNFPSKAGKERNEYLKKFKILVGCFHCGYKSCDEALHFHHFNTKDKIGATKMKTVRTSRLIEELKKCVLLCGNCHAEEHRKMRLK